MKNFDLTNYLTPERLMEAYNELIVGMQQAFESQRLLGEMEIEKAQLWASLLTIPDFKPGRSNFEQDAKMMAHYPEFMEGYKSTEEFAAIKKHQVEVIREKVRMFSDLMRLFALIGNDEALEYKKE